MFVVIVILWLFFVVAEKLCWLKFVQVAKRPIETILSCVLLTLVSTVGLLYVLEQITAIKILMFADLTLKWQAIEILLFAS